MDILQNIFYERLESFINENPESILSDDFDVEEKINNVIPEMANILKKSLKSSSKEMLKSHRSSSREFVKKNIIKWSEAFDLLETMIVICIESGSEFNKSYRPKAAEDNDLIFDIVVRHHARACHISQEILSLLKNGFADAAHARWRALHEVAVTAMFIAKHGGECAERFYFHDIVDSYNGMVEHKKHEDRLQAKGPTVEEISECKIQLDLVVKKYGKKFLDNYGWASYIFPNHTKVGFGAIEKDVKLDHMRPYYKWASQNIHTGSKAMRNRLGLGNIKEDILLVGQSDSGMTDPAHATAISLMQITVTLLTLEPTIDHIVISNIIKDYSDEIGNTFSKVENNE